MKTNLITKTLVIALATTLTVQAVPQRAHSAGMVMAMSATCGLAFLGLFIGIPVTAMAIYNISQEGWTLKNTAMLALGLIALDGESSNFNLQDLTPEAARQLNINEDLRQEYNSQRQSMNVMNQSLISEIQNPKVDANSLNQAYRVAYLNEFSSGARYVAEIIVKRSLNM